MKPHAFTYIWCPVIDGGYWIAYAENRRIAEMHYMNAISQETTRPPIGYRVVAQYKVDQHDWPIPPSLAHH